MFNNIFMNLNKRIKITLIFLKRFKVENYEVDYVAFK